jgi:basic membrane protein A and related proteins
MKKTISIVLAIVTACSALLILGACKKEETKATYEIAMITDLGTIDDRSFNQGAWEGVQQYANEFGKTFKYYKPTEGTNDAYVAAIDLAVSGGAKVVVCPGYLFEVPIYTAQTKYPAVSFILLDGAPHTADYATFKTEKNVASIFYAEQQAGFLAGYAVVKDGMTSLGFMGGMAVPAVIRFGYGYIQGAEAAAKEMGLAKNAITLKYNYTGKFEATPEAQTQAAGWFAAGTQVIFGCGGKLGNSVMAAAEAASKSVIGVDVDQSNESKTIITSAMKMLKKSVYDNLGDFYKGTLKGGVSQTLDAKVDGIGLPMATSKFTKFTQADYTALYAKVVAGTYTILTDTQAGTAGDPTTADTAKNLPALVTEFVKVEYVKA